MAAGAVMFLLLYLLVGRRMQAKEDGSAAPFAAKGTLNLKDHLTPEEIRILLSDLQVAADRASGTQKTAYTSLAGEIARSGKIKAEKLPLCVSAAEGGLGVFSAFGLAPARHSSLLDRLKKLDNEQ